MGVIRPLLRNAEGIVFPITNTFAARRYYHHAQIRDTSSTEMERQE